MQMELARIVADAILAAAADEVIAADREGIIRIWNAGAERIFGFVRDEAVGRALDLIIPEYLRAWNVERYRQDMQPLVTRFCHGYLASGPGVRSDGRRISVEFTILLLKDDERRLAGTAIATRDVTNRFDEMKSLRKELPDTTGS